MPASMDPQLTLPAIAEPDKGYAMAQLSGQLASGA